jgi:hypothetical protein
MKNELTQALKALSIKMGDSVLYVLPMFVSFFAPALWVALLIFLMTLVDTRTGMQSARQNGRSIRTSRFSDLFAKLIGYGTFLTAGLLLDKATGWGYFVWLSSLIPLYTEITSIDENQREMGKKGIIAQAEELYKFALNVKRKRDKLR